MDRREFIQTTAAGVLLPSLPHKGSNSSSNVPLDFAPTEQVTLYVARNGNDRNSGSELKPFATIARARDAVRDLKKQTKTPITVRVRKGTY